jgi:hypothetical protein
VMVPPGAPHHDELVIRCHDNGEVLASIRARRTASDQARGGESR